MLVFVLGCAGLSSLGFWQLDRAAQKRRHHEAYQAAQAAPPIDFELVESAAPRAEILWRSTRASGHYGEPQVLLDNRIRNGRPGYEVLAPFVTADGRTLLVNRGWQPAPADRSTPPRVPLPHGPVTLSGYFGPEPVVGIELAGAGQHERLSPALFRIQRVELSQLRALLETELWPTLVYLDAGVPGALDVAWPPPGDGSARHQAYAVQWFAMAAVLGGIGLWNLQRAGRRHG
ncbi:MAG: SURF1 family protein [Gammaproteobacteria bacterium]